jgi:hypothetical protein
MWHMAGRASSDGRCRDTAARAWAAISFARALYCIKTESIHLNGRVEKWGEDKGDETDEHWLKQVFYLKKC